MRAAPRAPPCGARKRRRRMPLHVGHLYARFVVAGSVVAISRLMAEVFTADAIALMHDAAGGARRDWAARGSRG